MCCAGLRWAVLCWACAAAQSVVHHFKGLKFKVLLVHKQGNQQLREGQARGKELKPHVGLAG